MDPAVGRGRIVIRWRRRGIKRRDCGIDTRWNGGMTLTLLRGKGKERFGVVCTDWIFRIVCENGRVWMQ